MEKINQSRLHLLSIAIITSILTFGCSTVANQLNKVQLHTIHFKVVDQNGNPVSGAIIEASNNESASTNSNGIANLRFGTVGVHNVTIAASGYRAETTTVSLPSDKGETITTHLVKPTDISGVNGQFNFGRIGQMPMGQLYPMFFSYLFSSHGYSLSITDYDPGEWTKWRIKTTENSDESLILKKAFLRKNAEGQQWWQLQLFEETDKQATYTAEILFSEDRSSVRRYREKLADQEAQEKPVQEGWYSDPAELTEESIEGATIESNVKIKVPSGEFSADLIEFGVAPGISLKIWKSEDVPGGTVQYLTSTDENQFMYKSELVDYGSDAETMLDSY